MELDEDFLTAPMGERPPLPGDNEEGQECRAFHPSAVKAFKIQTRLNATTIAQEEAKKADQVAAVERSAAVLHELQGGAIDGGGDGGLLLKNLDLDLFREKLLDKLGADWGRPTPELLQAQTTAEEAKAKHQARQAKGALETRMLEPITPPFSAWPNEVRVAIETGVFEPTTAWRDFTDSYLEAKAVISLGRNPFPAALLADLPDLTGIPIPKAAEGPDKPSATPVGLDTQDPEVQLAVVGRRGPYLCGPLGPTTCCKGYWRAGGGGTRLLQIRAGKAILQLVLDEPPDGLYNRWVKERLEYYRRPAAGCLRGGPESPPV